MQLSNLDLKTRQHIHGLFERLTENAIMLCLFLFTTLLLIFSLVPHYLTTREWFFMPSIGLYLAFMVIWTIKPVYEIRRAVLDAASEEEKKNPAPVYSLFCEGRWFYRAAGGMLGASIALLAILLLLRG